MDEDSTPVSKRARTEESSSSTLTENNAGFFDDAHEFTYRERTERSETDSQTTSPSSRRSSPSKQQRILAINFSGLNLRTIDNDEVVMWQSRRQDTETPRLNELFTCIATPGQVEDLELNEAVKILHMEAKRCSKRKGSEAMWRDCVVYPTLRAARRLCGREEVDIINV